MKRYKDWRPTKFDCSGLLGDYHGISDWFVCPVVQTRDSEALARSNFRCYLLKLGGEGDNIQVHRFGHWGPGWFEIILVKPDTPELETARQINAALEDYPVVDEDDFCMLEHEEKSEYWANMSLREKISICHESGNSIFAARRKEIPDGAWLYI
jgi:hypothetical protein